MPVQLIIDGQHVVDILSQIKQLSDALGGNSTDKTPVWEVDNEVSERVVTTNKSASVIIPEEFNQAVDVLQEAVKRNEEAQTTEVETPEKLSRAQHQIEADKMIESGKVDNKIYPLLSKVHQKRVTDALLGLNAPTPLEVAVAEKTQSDEPLFSNDEPLFEETVTEKVNEALLEDGLVTYDTIKDLLGEKCRVNGKDDPVKYTAAANIIKSFVAFNQEPKISNVPQDKLKELYYALSVI